MTKIKQIPAQALVKVTTEFGKHCLWEIHGLEEGVVLSGFYNPVNKAFDFYWNGEGAMLWIGQNGKLVSLGEDQRDKYMLLDRLRSDVEYCLSADQTYLLYNGSIAKHMMKMRELWSELNIKPEWITLKQIGKLEHKLNQQKTYRNRKKKLARPKKFDL